MDEKIILKKGYIKKLPRKNSYMKISMAAKERLFKLLESKNIEYFSVENQREEFKGRFSISEIKIEKNKDLVFEITNEMSESLILLFDSESLAQEWLKAIETVSRGRFSIETRLKDLEQFLEINRLTYEIEDFESFLSRVYTRSTIEKVLYDSYSKYLFENIKKKCEIDYLFKPILKQSIHKNSIIIKPMKKVESGKNQTNINYFDKEKKQLEDSPYLCSIQDGIILIEVSPTSFETNLDDLGKNLAESIVIENLPYLIYRKKKEFQTVLESHLYSLQKVCSIKETLRLNVDHYEMSSCMRKSLLQACQSEFFEIFYDIYLQSLICSLKTKIEKDPTIVKVLIYIFIVTLYI